MSRRKIVDLARERRIRTNLAKLKEMLAGNPELARRTHDALTGKLAAPDLEEAMAERRAGFDSSAENGRR